MKSLRIGRDNIWLCADCTAVACNGTHGMNSTDAKRITDGLEKLGPNLVQDFDIETGKGIRDFFFWLICSGCDTSMAGYRARFAQLEVITTNEQALTALEHAIEYIRQSTNRYNGNDKFDAAHILIEAHKAVGPLGQLPSWEREKTT